MSARKVGQLIPKGENAWLLRWFVGKLPNGKRKYASKVFDGTTYQAQRELSRLTNQVEEGTFVAPAKQTVQQYLKWWLENVCKIDVTYATLRSYTARFEHDIYPNAGMLKLHKLTWQGLQAVYNKLREAGKSGRTIQYTHTILKMALRHAVKGKLLKENPCDHATPGTSAKVEMAVWTAEAVQLFLERTQDERDYALWFTLLNTGLRPGEAFGVKWSDLQGDRLRILRAVTQVSKNVYGLEEPKTESSKRAVALTKENLQVLQTHRKRQAAEILAAGPEYVRQDFIFANELGGHDIDTYARRRWKRALVRVNRTPKGQEKARQLPRIRLYDTRHTHATMLLKANVHAKIVSERLGHASIKITLDTYSHVLPDMQDSAVTQFEALIAASR